MTRRGLLQPFPSDVQRFFQAFGFQTKLLAESGADKGLQFGGRALKNAFRASQNPEAMPAL
jgi:hypothetical protein